MQHQLQDPGFPGLVSGFLGYGNTTLPSPTQRITYIKSLKLKLRKYTKPIPSLFTINSARRALLKPASGR